MFISLLIVLFAGIVSFSHAELYDSPKKQLESGVLSKEIKCNEDRVLVIRDSDSPACVTENTADRMNWEIIKNMSTSVDTVNGLPTGDWCGATSLCDESMSLEISSENVLTDSNKQQTINLPTSISTEKITFSNHDSQYSTTVSEIGRDPFYWPKFNMTFPEQVKISESFDVVLDYTYVIPDEDTRSYDDPEEQCTSVHYCEQQDIWIIVPDYVDYINDDAIFENVFNDTKHLPTRTWNAYSIDPPYDNTKPLQETFTFVINQPTIDYRYGEIDISFNGDKTGLFYFNAAQNGIAYLDDKPMQSLGEGPGQLQDVPIYSEIQTREERLAKGPTGGPPVEFWEIFKDYLSRNNGLMKTIENSC